MLEPLEPVAGGPGPMRRHGQENNMQLTVGVIGYGISRTLLTCLLNASRLSPELQCSIRLKTLCGRNLVAARPVSDAFGFEKCTDRWEEIVSDPDINLLVNGGANRIHAEPSIRCLEAGKNVFCEKPLATSVAEALEMAAAARTSGRVHMTGFNYRFVPAVTLAWKLIRAGELGRLYQSRFSYADDAYTDPGSPYIWRMDRELSGRGVLADIGSHAIDLARFLIGQPSAVSGFARILVPQREGREVTAPDCISAALHFPDGSLAGLEASSLCTGKKNSLSFSIYGEKGAVHWDLEQLNDLHFYSSREEAEGKAGYRVIKVNNIDHADLVPWPGNYPLGVDHSYTLELRHLIACLGESQPIAPRGADFQDGLRAEEIAEAIEESSRSQGRLVEI
jgi:predicted dehydrogenase